MKKETVDPTEFDEELYEKAERFAEKNVDALMDMAILAYHVRKSRKNLAQLSFQWGRDARRMAKAVARWPEWFMETDGMPPRARTVDEVIALFHIASLDGDAQTETFEKWRDNSWTAWQVWDSIARDKEVAALTAGKVQRLKLDGVKVLEFGPRTIILQVPQELELNGADEVLWKGRSITLALKFVQLEK